MTERALGDDPMFMSTLDASWTEHARRGWTTLTSFGLQGLAVIFLLLLPLLRPNGSPLIRQVSTPISLAQPLGDTAPVPERARSGRPSSGPEPFVFRRPSSLPGGLRPAGEEGSPEVMNPGPCIPGAEPGDWRGVRNLFGDGTRSIVPVAPPTAAVPHPLQLSHMRVGDLIRKVQPAYPPLARTARVQGAVVLQAVISKDGTIENLKLLSGHPMLVGAAMEAVRQWRYRPYVLNNEPVEVETQITVNFSLAGN